MTKVLTGKHNWLLLDPRHKSKGPNTIRGHLLLLPRDGRWTFDGDTDRPTFAPSMNESWTLSDGVTNRNHYFYRAGRIEFLGDCTHSFAGQTLDLPDFTDVEQEYYADFLDNY